MKTRIITLMGLFAILVLNAREPQQLDTIYANEKMNMALFFPSNIRQGIVGSENFVFTYNREKGQTLGLLKATKGEHSNLLVITIDGKVYSYIIRYADILVEMNRFVSLAESIGDEKRMASIRFPEKDSITIVATSNAVKVVDSTRVGNKEYTQEFMDKSCASLLKRPERKNIIKRKDGMSLGIKNWIYYENLVFMQFEIRNMSGIDFDIDTLEVLKVNGNNKRKSSYQELPLKPVHIHGMPDAFRHGDKSRFVYVLPKFTLGDNEKIWVKLNESNGGRSMELK